MIAYNKTDAQAVFTMLADILKKVAATNFGDNQPIGNADLPNEIKRIVDADPTANTIRTAFEKAWDIAARAGDAETERELHTRHTDLIADFNTIDSADDQEGAGETYQRHLRSHAAWIRAVSASIDDSGKRETRGQPHARCDKGKKHKKVSGGWRKQIEMVGDFSKHAFKHCGKIYGAMTEEKAKDWETRYPDANKRERKSGYYSEVRRNPELKQEYWLAAARWNEYWRTFRQDFTAWLKGNPNGTIALFKAIWTPPGKTVAMNPTDKTLRYGADTRFADSPDGNDI